MESPNKIVVRHPETFFDERGIRVPRLVFRQEPFRFKPSTFTVGGRKMVEKTYNPSTQLVSLSGYLKSPLSPIVYGVSSQSNPSIALYFAAFLVQRFCELTHASNYVQWIRPSDFIDNGTVRNSPSLIVISGLTPNTPTYRLDKVFQLLDEWDNVPRIVVMTGEDPITYFATRLFYKVDRVFFHDENVSRREVEVV